MEARTAPPERTKPTESSFGKVTNEMTTVTTFRRVVTATPTAVTANGNSYNCFNASHYKYMYTTATKSAAEQKAIEHSVAMNCDGSAHDMSSMSMYMSGATHMACSGWSNVVSSARAATTTAAIALALAACALA